MSIERRTSVGVFLCDQLLKINDWVFLDEKTAGWNKDTICFKVADNKHEEWTRGEHDGDVIYQLNLYNDTMDTHQMVKEVKCLADVFKYCLHGVPLM